MQQIDSINIIKKFVSFYFLLSSKRIKLIMCFSFSLILIYIIKLKQSKMNLIYLIVLTLLTISCFSQIIPLDQEIIKQIFQQSKCKLIEDKQYLVYVHDEKFNIENQAAFFSYCIGQKLCTVLNPIYKNYYQMKQYVGSNLSQYFFIYSPHNKRKYILPAEQQITQNQILDFQYKYLHGQLQPFFSSEQLPQRRDERCKKIVGNNLGEFLRGPEKVKIIFLYTINSYCHSCDSYLWNYILYAQNHSVQDKVVFGYFNTFLNDHPAIVDEKSPSILVFIGQQWMHSYQISPDKLQTLSTFIEKILNPSNEAQEKTENKPISQEL